MEWVKIFQSNSFLPDFQSENLFLNTVYASNRQAPSNQNNEATGRRERKRDQTAWRAFKADKHSV